MTAHIIPPANAASDEVRRFLAKVSPWPKSENDGYINIHWTVRGRDGGKPIWTGRAVRCHDDEAVSTLDWVKTLPDARDVYLCLSRQRTAQEKISKKGNKFLQPVRAQTNAMELKSLYLDIDFKGPPNGYSTKDEALRALAKFLRETRLPKPSVIVLSGGGMHVYFTMERPLTVPEWQPFAHALAAAGRQHGLRFDSACTVDAARVLRIPNTKNFKTDPPRPVVLAYHPLGFDYPNDRLEGALAPYKIGLPALRADAPSRLWFTCRRLGRALQT